MSKFSLLSQIVFLLRIFAERIKKIKYRIKTVTSERCNTHLNHSVKSNIPKKKNK